MWAKKILGCIFCKRGEEKEEKEKGVRVVLRDVLWLGRWVGGVGFGGWPTSSGGGRGAFAARSVGVVPV